MRQHRITSLEDPAFGALFAGIRESWRRIETLQVYDVSYERGEYEAFLRTGAVDFTPGRWEEMIASHVAAGRALRRVHVVETPLTDYMRYEMAYYRVAAAAGEDVRIILVPRGQWPAGILRRDDWVFDSREVWRMKYDRKGRFLHTDRRDRDLRPVMRSWDAAWRQAVPLADVTVPLLRTA